MARFHQGMLSSVRNGACQASNVPLQAAAFARPGRATAAADLPGAPEKTGEGRCPLTLAGSEMFASEVAALPGPRGPGLLFSLLARGRDSCGAKRVGVAFVTPATEVAAEGAKPAEHVFPGEEHGDRYAMLGGIFRVPAVDGYRVAGLFIIVRKDGRELLDGHVRGEFFPAIVEPRFGIERVVVAGADGIVPIPGTE